MATKPSRYGHLPPLCPRSAPELAKGGRSDALDPRRLTALWGRAMTLAGALVTCRQTGTILYVVDRRADDGIRWRLHAKRVDASGRSEVTGRTAGACDLVQIRPTPTYSL
jgi:hypothetical protein